MFNNIDRYLPLILSTEHGLLILFLFLILRSEKVEEIAELLMQTRLESGIELDEVSKDLNISKVFLTNIEEGKIGSFKDIFVLKNYITEYAKYLGLDSSKIINEFNEYLFEYTSRIPISSS